MPVVIKELALVGVSAWKEVELFERGIKVLRGLGEVTAGIPGYVEHFDETRGGELRHYLVQEWIAGRSLAERLEAGARFDEARARTIAGELLRTLATIHGLSPPIVHRDVKPGNIIERDDGDDDDGRPRYILVDFDLVQDTMRPWGGSTMALGTIGYAPLEQLMGQARPASDLYGLGATLIALLSRREPSDLYDPSHHRLEFRDHVHVGASFAEVLARMVAPSIEDRFSSAEEVIEALASSASLATQRPSLPDRGARRSAAEEVEADELGWLYPAVVLALIVGFVAMIAASLGGSSTRLGLIIAAGLASTFLVTERRLAWIVRRLRPRKMPRGEVEAGRSAGAIAAPRPKGSSGRRRLGRHFRRAGGPTIAEVGRGIGGVEVGRSTAADVLGAFGDDCTCYSYEGGDIPGPRLSRSPELAESAQVWKISYDYDEEGVYCPDRRRNRRRPAAVMIDTKRARVQAIELGVYQSEITTAEGLRQGSTVDEVIAAYGEDYELDPGEPLDKYWYAAGIELWVNHESGLVNSFHIFPPERP